MPRNCHTCKHPQRDEIDERLARGHGTTTLSRQYDIHPDALERHRQNHLPNTIAAAKQQDREADRGDRLLDQLRWLQGKTLHALRQAEQSGDHATLLSAVREARQTVESIGKMTGAVDDRPQVIVTQLPEWSIVMSVLAQHPEVRAAVARALTEQHGHAPTGEANVIEAGTPHG